MEDPGIYELKGTDGNDQVGGLIIMKKKPSDHTFKKPLLPSILGLDKLADKKRNEEEPERSSSSKRSSKKEHDKRKYRAPQDETPTHTGGVDREAKERLERRLKRQRHDGYNSRRRDDDRDDRDRRRNRDRDRDYDRRSDRRDSHRQESIRFRDEPRTPQFKTKVSFGAK